MIFPSPYPKYLPPHLTYAIPGMEPTASHAFQANKQLYLLSHMPSLDFLFYLAYFVTLTSTCPTMFELSPPSSPLFYFILFLAISLLHHPLEFSSATRPC